MKYQLWVGEACSSYLIYILEFELIIVLLDCSVCATGYKVRKMFSELHNVLLLWHRCSLEP